MDSVTAMVWGGIALASADVVGHCVNAVRLHRLRNRVEASVARAEADREAILAEVAAIKAALPSAEAIAASLKEGAMRGGMDPSEMSEKGVAAREAKALRLAEGSAKVAALLGEYLPMVESLAPEAVKAAKMNPAIAERVLAPLLARIAPKNAENGNGGGWR